MAFQRRWYVGQVEGNSDMRKDGKLVSVRFRNGAVLRNVRPDELRSVPRTTCWGWISFLLFVLVELCAIGSCFYVALFNLDPANRGRVWMFPDYQNVSLGDGQFNTTVNLYNLTYRQVAAADASPRTWLRVMWWILYSGPCACNGYLMNETYVDNMPEEFLDWGMGANDPVQIGRSLSLSSREHINFYREVQSKIFVVFCGWATLHYIPLYLMLFVNMELRRLPIHVQISAVVLPCLVQVALTYNSLSDLAGYFSEDARRNLLTFRISYWVRFIFSTNLAFMWLGWPILAAKLQERRRAKHIVNLSIVVFSIVMTAVAILTARFINGWFALYKVLDSDYGLEGMAAAITYLISTAVDLDYNTLLTLPLVFFLIAIIYNTKGGRTVWDVWAIAICAAIMGPVCFVIYLVAEPFTLVDPVNWRFLFAVAPFSRTAGAANLMRDYINSDLFMYLAYATSVILLFDFFITLTFQKIIVAYRMQKVHSAARHALISWMHPSSMTNDRHPGASAGRYQPLNQRPPSRNVILPLVTYFQDQLARPQTTLQGTCLNLLSTQVKRETLNHKPQNLNLNR